MFSFIQTDLVVLRFLVIEEMEKEKMKKKKKIEGGRNK